MDMLERVKADACEVISSGFDPRVAGATCIQKP